MSILGIVGGAVGLYKIVPVNEAHVRVMFNKKEVFMSRKKAKVDATEELKPDTEEYKSSYWTIPFVTKVTKLPLSNLRIDAPDIKLNDKNMAKFMCDVVCFVNIDNPILAAERTEITVSAQRYEGIDVLTEDFKAILESIMRTVATKQSILDVYMDRNQLDTAVTLEVAKVFPQWGLRLVDLEIKDLKDVSSSTIIQDIERKQAAQINADARVKVAEETKRAEIAEATNKREAEMKKAETEQDWRKRQIEKDREIAIAQAEQQKQSALKQAEANEEMVEARRKKEVGDADVDREATIKRAEATKSKATLESEGEAQRIKNTGTAEADIIKAKKVADAEGTEKLAFAQQKFNDAATNIELIKANKEVGIAYTQALAKVFEHATVNIVAGSTQEILSGGLAGNVSLGAKEGVAVQQFLQGTGNGKVQLEKIASAFGFVKEKKEVK